MSHPHSRYNAGAPQSTHYTTASSGYSDEMQNLLDRGKAALQSKSATVSRFSSSFVSNGSCGQGYGLERDFALGNRPTINRGPPLQQAVGVPLRGMAQQLLHSPTRNSYSGIPGNSYTNSNLGTGQGSVYSIGSRVGNGTGTGFSNVTSYPYPTLPSQDFDAISSTLMGLPKRFTVGTSSTSLTGTSTGNAASTLSQQQQLLLSRLALPTPILYAGMPLGSYAGAPTATSSVARDKERIISSAITYKYPVPPLASSASAPTSIRGNISVLGSTSVASTATIRSQAAPPPVIVSLSTSATTPNSYTPSPLMSASKMAATPDYQPSSSTDQVEFDTLSNTGSLSSGVVTPPMLLQMAELLNTDLRPERVVQRLMEAAGHLIQAERIALLLLNETREELVVHCCKDNFGLTGFRISASKGLGGYCAKTGRSVMLNGTANIQQDWRYDSEADARPQISTLHSVLQVAVRNHTGQTIGLLESINAYFDGSTAPALLGGSRVPLYESQCTSTKTTNNRIGTTVLPGDGASISIGFTEQDETLLRSIALFVSTVLHKAELEREATHRRKQADALLQVAELTSAEFGVRRAIQRILRSTNLVLNCNCEAIQLYMVDERNSELVCVDTLTTLTGSSNTGIDGESKNVEAQSHHLDLSPPLSPLLPPMTETHANITASPSLPPRIAAGQGFIGQCAVTGRCLLVNDMMNEWHSGSGPGGYTPEKGWKNLLVAPIRDVTGKTSAVLCAANKKAKSVTQHPDLPSGGVGDGSFIDFTSEDKDLIGAVVITAAGILHQARLYDEAVYRRKQTEALLHITELMSAELGTEKVVPRIIEATYALVPAERISLFMVEELPVNHFHSRQSIATSSFSVPSSAVATTPPTTVTPGLIGTPTIVPLTSPILPPLPMLTRVQSSTSVLGGGTAAMTTLEPMPSPLVQTFTQRERELVCVISKDKNFKGSRIQWGQGIVGHVALTGRSLNIPQAYLDSRFDPATDRKTGFVTKSILTVPVFDLDGHCMAVIQAVNRSGGDGGGGGGGSVGCRTAVFSAEDVTIVESMAVSAGIILRKSLVYRAAMVAERRSNALMKMVKLVSNRTASLMDIIQGVVQVIQSVLCADRVTIFFVDAQRRELFSIVSQVDSGTQTSADSTTPTDYTMPVGRGFAGWVAAHGRTVNITNPQKDPRYDPNIERTLELDSLTSLLCVPVHDQDDAVIAVIQAANRKKESAVYHNFGSGSITAETKLDPLCEAIDLLTLDNLRPVGVTSSAEESSSVSMVASSASIQLPAFADFAAISNHDNHPLQPSSPPPAYSPPFLTAALASRTAAHTGRAIGDFMANNSTHQAAAAAATLAAGQKQEPSSEPLHASVTTTFTYTNFSADDVQIIEAFATEVSSTLHRCLTDAILEHYADSSSLLKPDLDGLSSLVDFYNRRPNQPQQKLRRREPQTAVGGGGGIGAWSENRMAQLLGSAISTRFVWPSKSVSQSTFTDLQSLSFNVWHYSEDDLLAMAVQLFQDMGLCVEFEIPLQTLQQFVLQVRKNYHPNAFHNWYHAFSVFHFSYLFMRLTKVTESMSQLDVLAMMVASLCHDLDHPGRTNSFEVNTNSRLALLHNDHSVLENHHVSTLFSILSDSRYNIFSNLPKPAYRAVRATIINAILATDMAIHFDRSKDLDQRETRAPFDSIKEKERQYLIDMVVHSSDLSGQVFPTVVAALWEEKISAEFDSQAKEEQDMGLPVAPFMRNLNVPHHRAKLQVNFIEFVLDPWWKNVVRLFPALLPCYENLQTNKTFFQGQVKHEEALELKSAADSASTTINTLSSLNNIGTHATSTAELMRADGLVAPSSAEIGESPQ